MLCFQNCIQNYMHVCIYYYRGNVSDGGICHEITTISAD